MVAISSWMLFAAEFNMRHVVPILALVAVMAAVYFVYAVFFNREGGKTEERLERIGRMSMGEMPTASTSAGGERFQDLLQKAAPSLAKPLQPKTEEESSKLKVRLANGGWRGENAVSVFLACKVAALLVGVVLALFIVTPNYGFDLNGIMYFFIVMGIVFYVPELIVRYRVGHRQKQIFMGLPDALDLMVVCVEAGLGLDAAMRKVCEEMGMTFPIISEEFSICNFQLQMGRPRREVLHDLGIRTGVDDMKALSAILIQADRFGSSIAQALRVQSDSMRVRRRQLAEEKAQKTAVTLLLPLIMFIFPAVFVVLVGPAAIQIMKSFGLG